MYCPNCGSQQKDDSQFCGACGSRLEQVTVPERKKKKKSILPVLIIALVLVAVVVVAGVWLMGGNGAQTGGSKIFGSKAKQTLYLRDSVRNVSYLDILTQEVERVYSYDDEGVLLGYEFYLNTDMADEAEYDTQFSYEYEYEYDEDGLLIAGEVKCNQYGQKTITAEYEYSKDGFLERIILMDEEGEEYEVECDENGLIESASLGYFYSYEYDEEGNLKTRTTGDSDTFKIVYTYENGRLISMKQYNDNELVYGYEYEYDEYGHTTRYEIKDEFECVIDYTYDKDGRILEFKVTEETSDGENNEITGEFEWDGTQEAVITFDGDDINGFSLCEDYEIELEYDEHGNLLSMEWYEDGVLCAEHNYTYKEVTVPGDYKEVNIDNPVWLTFFQ